MIAIEHISVDETGAFWERHYDYLEKDGLLLDDEDRAYFQSEAYRGVIEAHMRRAVDTHAMVYFSKEGKRVGAAQYCTFQSEDGKCVILDFWVFAPNRGRGLGSSCFAALEAETAREGARYYQINCDGRDDRMRFWKRLGFVEHGLDEYGVLLLEKRGAAEAKVSC